MSDQEFNNFLDKPQINWKYTIVVVILIFFISIVIFSYMWLTKKEFAAALPMVIKEKEKQEKISGEKILYYYSQTYNPDVFTFYNLNSNISLENKIIKKLEGRFFVLGKFLEKRKFLLCENKIWPCGNKLYLFNAETGELKNFLTLEKGKNFSSAVFSHNKNFLAYSLYLKNNNEKPTGEVWLYDLKKKNHRKIFEKKSLELYTNLIVLGWNSSDDKVIVEEIGRDAGAVWGDIYLVDLNKNNFRKIEIPNSKKDYLLGELSPNGENWLYIYCQKPTENLEGYGNLCEEGEEILIYNLAKSTSSSIYKNLSYADNKDRGKLRKINSAVWQDDENIVFSVPGGINKINLKTKKLEELYKFGWHNPDEIFKSPVIISFADKDFVIYKRFNLYGGNFVLDLTTKKIIELGEKMFDVNGFVR